MDVSIRLATPEDLPDVMGLYGQSGLDQDCGLTLAEAEQWFQRLQQYPNYRLWVATLKELDDRRVGTFTLLVMDNLVHHGSPSGVVEGVAVDPEFQGQGIGQQMMQFAAAQCRTAGCYKLSLSTNLKRQEAHAFYESLGFQKHGYSFLVEL
ncbi:MULTISPECIES: GNAT family N-acetyltransferase [Cyanophyceae]|uniref:GNAT family N-acetyltransferase n=1 Tax=Cyanophyceae TaxID=3028117 RepID=UPI001685FE6D|nr:MULTISPECIES: GNAT family N-acetyltransferase [Cyanophyceae]MBD1915457.1 GNAT family N-acetyltransferase [Phormidium sp. FACHB-77]MBD2028528.1 GNAT family N-acetyltransferase [Phormidium sp. FACHB-322]MBD2051068.1 GNAT family N-acetyltransferase [Leptolyngbya sp. FACHB-60]